MSEVCTGGDIVAAVLEACGVDVVFGVVSIHNLPILDALMRRGAIRCVPARGEAGATNMADAYARVRPGLGVVVTSTGTGSGNACGAMVEAQTAGTPLLHLTGQIEVPYLDRDRAYIHEAKDQLGMLAAVAKRAYRVWSTETLLGTLREAIAVALTPPMGPVAVEIPIDVQSALVPLPWPDEIQPLAPGSPPLDREAIRTIARALAGARRPLLWAGGGARGAAAEVRALAARGIGVVTSTQGRGVIDETDPMALGSFTASPSMERLYATSDAMLVVGSRLRGSETLRYSLKLPETIYQIDADPLARNRNYQTRHFAVGNAAEALALLLAELPERLAIDPAFVDDLAAARSAARLNTASFLGVYESIVDAIGEQLTADAIWVRDITLGNSIWGNRYLPLSNPRAGVHAVGGGIGQGVPMAIGAALAAGPTRKVIAISGDGGLQLCLGELSTLVQEQANVVMIVFNDGGYGVIKNIQDDKYGGRKWLTDLVTPDLQLFAQSIGLESARVSKDPAEFAGLLANATARPGPSLIEIDMLALGPYAKAFAGPPVRETVPA